MLCPLSSGSSTCTSIITDTFMSFFFLKLVAKPSVRCVSNRESKTENTYRTRSLLFKSDSQPLRLPQPGTHPPNPAG